MLQYVRINNVPDRAIEHPRDAIVRITAGGVSSSDLHLFNDLTAEMEKGDFSPVARQKFHDQVDGCF